MFILSGLLLFSGGFVVTKLIMILYKKFNEVEEENTYTEGEIDLTLISIDN